jgi:hypothetical protein
MKDTVTEYQFIDKWKKQHGFSYDVVRCFEQYEQGCDMK